MTEKIAVVVPAFRVREHILDVLGAIGPECARIYVIDDACPDQSGRWVEEQVSDPRVKVIYHEVNKGVGGAVMSGYRAALEDGMDIIVKVDGDGQMDPRLIPRFALPLRRGEADYTKGNRFYSLYNVRQMPAMRLFGNAVLSFMTKLSSGYWHLFDPTNGYTAIHATVLRRLHLHKVSERYFFESDMLIQLGDLRAVVEDVPMEAVYGDETSNLTIRRVAGPFLWNHARAAARRIVYSYLLRDFSLASANLLTGVLLLVFGSAFGAGAWARSIATGIPATTGTVMLSVLPIIVGFQLLLFFLGYDISVAPRRPLQGFESSTGPGDRSAGGPALQGSA